MSERTCRHCDQTKPLADFWNPRNSRHAKWCSICLALRCAGELYCKASECSGKIYSNDMCRTHYERVRYAANRESILAGLRARYEADSERFLAWNRKWADANRERKAAADAAWRAANLERKRATDAANYARRREEIKARAATWYAENRDKAAESQKAWRAANAEVVREAHARRRALKAGADARLTAAEWRHILAEFDHACAYCQARDMTLEQEHMTPLSRGGHHVTHNVVPACRACNGRKSTKTIFEFLAVA